MRFTSQRGSLRGLRHSKRSRERFRPLENSLSGYRDLPKNYCSSDYGGSDRIDHWNHTMTTACTRGTIAQTAVYSGPGCCF